MLERRSRTGYLPPGIHDATLEEVEIALTWNMRRREIMKGLRHVVDQLMDAGTVDIWVDGSFVTDKQRPSDVDVVYDPPDLALLSEPGIFNFARRAELKKYRMVDLWPHPSPQPRQFGGGTVPIREWWQSDINGVKKGIVRLQMEVAPNDSQ